jgi:hypothetical protein
MPNQTLRESRGQIQEGYKPEDFKKPEERSRKTQFIGDIAREMKAKSGAAKVQYIADWKDYLPKGSQWMPGLPGKADCAICKGLGWVRIDLPLGHPMHGKAFACECRRGESYPRLG